MINFTFEKRILFVLPLILFSACNSVKNLTYFQKTRAHQSDTLSVSKFYVPRIRTGDLIQISVNSLNPEASSFFNPYSVGGISASSAASASGSSPGLAQSSAPGYLVDSAGRIDFPLLGIIKINGFTTIQVRDTIKSMLVKGGYLREPTVIVRFLNFKVTMLGEVNRPEVYNIPNEMITLPEAISMAGDLTLYAQRDSIEIIRDTNGKKLVGFVNLNSREVFNSPYYYLHANDLVYVMPSKFKAQHNDRALQISSLAVSLVTALLFIFRR